MDSRDHIIRTNSFFDGQVFFDDDYRLYDNCGNIIANKIAFEVPMEARWSPDVVEDDNGDILGIHLGGRVYYIHIIAEIIRHWETRGVITDEQVWVFVDLMRSLVHEDLYWDLNYHFPAYYFPVAERNGLQSTNVWGFLRQFPSDPYVIALDSETVDTETTMTDDEDGMNDWEMLLDAILDL